MAISDPNGCGSPQSLQVLEISHGEVFQKSELVFSLPYYPPSSWAWEFASFRQIFFLML